MYRSIKHLIGTSQINSIKNAAHRDRWIIDIKYLTYGFSFLQDAVERTLIEIQTNNSVPIGIYAQQNPEPCYRRDM
jgi:hypothetical protein